MNRHRSDIQGLRAIGALLVAVYHIWIGRVSGGVDVFFVVSGYLLVGSLSRQLATTQSIELRVFVSGLMQRLLPMSWLTIFLLVITGWMWIPKMRWDSTIEQMSASAMYVQNWYLAINSIDYLDRDVVGSPVQHYWAMSAQAQALVVLAVVLAATGWAAKRLGLHLSLAHIGVLLWVVFAASLAYSTIMTARNQPFAYYDTFARVWEFVAGGLVSIYGHRLALSDLQRIVSGWVALAAIIACGIVLDVSTVFPGFAALWPVVATGVLLVAGQDDSSSLSASSFLRSRVLVGLGNVSYGLYLWHWPVLVVFQTLTFRTEASILEGTAILLISLLFAVVSTALVEQRRRQAFSGRSPAQVLLVSVVSVAVLGTGLLIWRSSLSVLTSAEATMTGSPGTHPGALALVAQDLSVEDHRVLPGPLTARRDRGLSYEHGCVESIAGRDVKSCTFGPESARFTLAIVGGSHSAQWVDAFVDALSSNPDWRVVTYLKSACPFSSSPALEEETYWESCRDWNISVVDRLLTSRPALTMVLVTRTTWPTSDLREHVPDGYRDQWNRLLEADLKVLGLRDTPRFGFQVPECVEIKGPRAPGCTVDRLAVLADQDPAGSIEEISKIEYIDMSDIFCRSWVCPAVVGNVLVYRDQGHVTATYMRTLAPLLAERLTPIIHRTVGAD